MLRFCWAHCNRAALWGTLHTAGNTLHCSVVSFGPCLAECTDPTGHCTIGAIIIIDVMILILILIKKQ